MNKVIGFKCFQKGLINRFGQKMELDKMYEIKGEPKFMKQGFHMCENIEDTLRYFDGMNNEVDICKVTGYPNIYKYDDDYNEYYNMYSCQKIVINELLTRQEIIKQIENINELKINRFIYGYKLNNDEIKYLIEKYKNKPEILCHIIYMYYDKDIYNNTYNEKVKKINNIIEALI